MKHKVIGLDLAKNTSQIGALNEHNKVVRDCWAVVTSRKLIKARRQKPRYRTYPIEPFFQKANTALNSRRMM